jgi:hypothetical protein
MLRVFCLMVVLLVTPISAKAQSYVYVLYGTPLSCTATTGQPVRIFVNEFALQFGGGVAVHDPNHGPTITLSPSVMASVPPLSAFMIFYHECAHLALPFGVGVGTPSQERNADCYAIRAMRSHGLINNWQQFRQAVVYADSISHGGGFGLTSSRVQSMYNCITSW